MAEAHIRTDDGVKREPKHPIHKLRRAKEGQAWTVPAEVNPDQVIMEYLTEGKTSGIAAKYGVRRSVLTRWLQEHRPKEWKEAQVIRALCMKEDRQEAIYDSTSGLALARARAVVDSSQWDLERLDSANYGQKQELTVQVDHRYQVEAGLFESALELVKSMRGVALTTIDAPHTEIIEDQKKPDQS